MTIEAEDLEFFRKHGYVVLPNLFSETEIESMLSLFDRDYETYPYFWHPFGNEQIINCDSLATSPEIDEVIRHPRLQPIVEELMDGPLVFSEICLRIMKPFEGKEKREWHRDRPHWEENPLRMDYIQAAIYLTDVHEASHCFSISPESIEEDILPRDEQLARGGMHDIHGPAGTVILFNVSVLHTATVRPTDITRKTIQTYYGHRGRPKLSDDSFVPAALWYSDPDAETRAFYGTLNEKTRMLLRGSATPVAGN